jgi:hypothetical protein
VAFSFEELHSMYTEFEKVRIEKAQAMVGIRPMKPDHFCKFLVDRTQFCPHKLLDSMTTYWLETITLLDGEQGVTLPAPMDEIPIVFFDALSIVRNARAMARKEDKKD